MSSGIDEFLDHVDQWKLKLHQKLKRMTRIQRKTFWQQFHEEARTRGLRVVDVDKKVKGPGKRTRLAKKR
jgi:hypothetical protein